MVSVKDTPEANII